MVGWFGNVGCQAEFGRTIRVTCRVFAKSMLIRVYDCVAQYKRCLKTERYAGVQVVLLLALSNIYQGISYEDVLKYGGGDTS